MPHAGHAGVDHMHQIQRVKVSFKDMCQSGACRNERKGKGGTAISASAAHHIKMITRQECANLLKSNSLIMQHASDAEFRAFNMHL